MPLGKLLIIVSLLLLSLSGGCSGFKDLPTLPVRFLTETEGTALIENENIQRFEIENFIVIFNPREMRITIIPQHKTGTTPE